ncbi:MAG: alpha/beta fold hydrolase [Hyphomicrobiaceae bacterium]
MATFLLIHGAYQGGWIWKPIVERLHAAGHSAYAPSLDGCAERAHQMRAGIKTETHADEMAQFLHYHDLTDVILVGTSSGGMVMARLAEQVPERIARLVFADALMLMDGEKIRDIVTRPAAVNTDLALGPSQEDAETRLLAGLDPDLRRWAAERFTLHPTAVFHQPVKLERFWDMTWKASVLYCSQAVNPGEAHLRRGAEKLGAQWHVIDTGHYPMLSTPDQLLEVILAQ